MDVKFSVTRAQRANTLGRARAATADGSSSMLVPTGPGGSLRNRFGSRFFNKDAKSEVAEIISPLRREFAQ